MAFRLVWIRLTILALVAAILPGFSGSGEAAARDLLGAGATFPYPLYSKMFDDYSRRHEVKIRYDASGSGAGIEQIIAKKVDFAGSDAFMSEQEQKDAGAPILHIPTCLGAVVITYNLPGNPRLKFTPDLISDIFLGKVQKWNDPRIGTLNKEANLPDMGITVIHRAEASGTTFIFSEYLSKVSREWQDRIGTGKSLSWPVGRGSKGNPGVAGMVNQIPGAIGYVELVYALGNGMTVGAVRNKAGGFVDPTPESVSLSAQVQMTPGASVSLTDTLAPGGYPLSGFTWLLVYKEQNYAGRARDRATDLANLLWWVTHEGQRHAAILNYAPLPEESITSAEGMLKSLTFDGRRLLQ